jgi:hypothetical protein
MSYGSAEGVAAFVPRFVNASGRFDNVTTPTLIQVDEWRAQLSAALDVAMSGAGLPSPANTAAVVEMLDGFVNGSVAWLVESVNGQGRYQERPASTREIMQVIMDSVAPWVTSHALSIAAASGITEQAGVGGGAGSRLPVRMDEWPSAGEYSRAEI